MSQSIPGNLVSLHCLDFQAEDRLTPRWQLGEPCEGNLFSLHYLDFQGEDRLTSPWHVGKPYGKASWESLMGKSRRKATDPLIHEKGSVTLLLHLGRTFTFHFHALEKEIVPTPVFLPGESQGRGSLVGCGL